MLFYLLLAIGLYGNQLVEAGTSGVKVFYAVGIKGVGYVYSKTFVNWRSTDNITIKFDEFQTLFNIEKLIFSLNVVFNNEFLQPQYQRSEILCCL